MSQVSDAGMRSRVRNGNDDRLNPNTDWLTGWQALILILVLLLAGWHWPDLVPTPMRLAGLLAWMAVAVAFLLTRRVAVIVAFAIALGFLLRWADFSVISGSDVKFAINEWLGTLLSGQNPYDHFYLTTIPPGSPVGYPPIQFLVHAPGYLLAGLDGVRFTEIALATAVMGCFAWLGQKSGWKTTLPALALYACLPNLVNLSLDGSNDTSSGAVLLLAVIAVAFADQRAFAARPTLLAGVAGALALGMKQTALFIILGIIVWIGQRAGRAALQRYVIALGAVLLAVSVPFLIWDAPGYFSALASFAGAHTEVWGWNIWFLASQLGWAVPDPDRTLFLSLVVTAAAVVLLIVARPQRLTAALIGGVLVTLVVLVTARWTSYAYFALLAPVVLIIPWLIDREDRAASPRRHDEDASLV